VDDQITGNNLKRDKGRFEHEEVVARRNSKGFVDVSASEANEGGRDWQVGHHFSHAWRITNQCLAFGRLVKGHRREGSNFKGLFSLSGSASFGANFPLEPDM